MALLKTVDGGRLLSDVDPRTIGPENCSRRLNIRREDDAETLLAGWVKFAELPGPCIHLFRAARPNGDRDILAFTSTAIYLYDVPSKSFNPLIEGLTETSRWEAVNLDGYVLFNNGLDLPFTWDWDTVEPIHELREQGIVRCGTMWGAYNFLLFADITEFSPDAHEAWMNGADDPYGYVPSDTDGTTRTPYRVVWSDKPREWGVVVKATLRGEGSTELVLNHPCVSLKVGEVDYSVHDAEIKNFTNKSIISRGACRVVTEKPVGAVAGYFARITACAGDAGIRD